MTKVQSKNAILFDIVNDAGPLRDGLVEAIGEGTTVEPGLISADDKTKLDGIAAGATANAADAALRDRTTHTGEQAISTITGLTDALAGKATAEQGALANTAVQPADLGTYDTEADFVAANVPPTLTFIQVDGYYEPNDGGGHSKVRLGAAPDPVKPWHKQSADGAWWQVAARKPNPKIFGAKGDGVADDSAALTSADAYAAFKQRTLEVRDGDFPCAEIQMTAAWSMAEDAKLLYNGTTGGECVRCTVSYRRFGNIYIDCDGREPLTAFFLSGGNNKYGSVEVANAISTDQPWVFRGVYVTSDNNTIETARFRDLNNVGNGNDSSPQALTMTGTADGNKFGLVVGENICSLVVDNSSGANYWQTIDAVGAEDNGYYGVGSGCRATIGLLRYDGQNDAAGFRSGANAYIDSVVVLGGGDKSIFFGDCGDVTINSLHFPGERTGSALHLNVAAAGSVKIGRITGKFKDTSPFFLEAPSGTIEYLTIDHIDIVVRLTAAATLSTRSFLRWDACQGIRLGDVQINVIFDGFVATDPFYCRFNHNLTYRSHLDKFRVGFFQSDGITLASVTYFAVGFDGTTQQSLVQQNLQIGEGCLSAENYLRSYTYAKWKPNRMIKDAAPTVGYWERGAILWAENPTASLRGRICTASGTPGTWSDF